MITAQIKSAFSNQPYEVEPVELIPLRDPNAVL